MKPWGRGVGGAGTTLSRDTRGLVLILAAFLQIKRSGRVLRAMGRNRQVQTQQLRASGAVNLSRYECFCEQVLCVYLLHVLCAVFCMSYVQMFVSLMCRICMSSVQYFVCVMCGLQSVLCAVFSLCYVQFAVTSLVASLRACLASLAWLASLAVGSSTNT